MPQINNIYTRNADTDAPERDVVAEEYLKKIGTKCVGIDLQTDLFSNISLGSLPNNFQMHLSPIDYPKKDLSKNPNGLLFIDPRDIDRTAANDIALQCFGGDFSSKAKKTSTMNPDSETNPNPNPNESLTVNERILKMLFEDTADPNMFDVNVKVQDIKSRNERMMNLNTTVVRAITTYISRSTTAIKPLIELVAGQNSGSIVKNVMKAIETANQTSWNTVKDWLQSHSEVDKSRKDFEKDKEIQELKNISSLKQQARIVFSCIALSAPANNKIDYLMKAQELIDDIEDKEGLNKFIRKMTPDFDDYKEFYRKYANEHHKKPFQINLNQITSDVNDSINYNGKTMLVEDAINKIFEDDESSEDTAPKEFVNYDLIYDDLVSMLTQTISEAIGPREEWSVFKGVKEAMEKLLQRANAEIDKKIDIICKSGTEASQKSLAHHPFKAEGLKTLWSRYDSDLLMKIKSRVDSLTGSNGSMSTGTAEFLEDTLKVTYPRIIACMLVYRCVFQQIYLRYKGGFVPDWTVEDVREIVQAHRDADDTNYEAVIDMYDNVENTPA